MRMLLLCAGLYVPAIAHSWPGPKYLDVIPDDSQLMICGDYNIVIAYGTPYRLRRETEWARVDHRRTRAFVELICPENRDYLNALEDDDRESR